MFPGAPVVVFVALLALYLAVPCERASNDNYGSELTALSLARGEHGYLDGLRPWLASPLVGHRCTVIETARGRMVAGTGFGVALALAPFYAIAEAAGLPAEVVLSDRFNQLFAASWSALAAAVFLAAVLRLRDLPAAWVTTAALALGSPLLSILSQEVWQHTLLVALDAVAVWLLTGPAAASSRWRMLAAGAAAGWAMTVRPSGVFFALPLAWAAWRIGRARAGSAFLIGMAPWAAALAAYNWLVFGSPLTVGQTIIGMARFGGPGAGVFGLTPAASLAGVLFSPGRGWFVYCPVFAVALTLLPLVLGRRGRPTMTAATDDDARRRFRTLLAPALVIIGMNFAGAAAWKEWAGGWTYGPRYASDPLVFWGVVLVLGLSALRGLARRARALAWTAVAASLALSVTFHAAGLLVSPDAPDSSSAVFQPDAHPEAMWRWDTFPPLYNLRLWRSRHAGGPLGARAVWQ